MTSPPIVPAVSFAVDGFGVPNFDFADEYRARTAAIAAVPNSAGHLIDAGQIPQRRSISSQRAGRLGRIHAKTTP
jgi:hypothetical protein